MKNEVIKFELVAHIDGTQLRSNHPRYEQSRSGNFIQTAQHNSQNSYWSNMDNDGKTYKDVALTQIERLDKELARVQEERNTWRTFVADLE